MFTRSNYPPILWSQNGRLLTWDLINLFVDYPQLRQRLWPAMDEKSSKTRTYKEIAIRLLRYHDIYGEHVRTPPGLKKYAQSVKTQIYAMQTKWREANVKLGAIGASFMHEDEIWKEERGKGVRNIWAEVRESCPYYYDLKRLLGDRLMATDYMVGNSTDLVHTSGVLRKQHAREAIYDVISDEGGEDMSYTNSEPEESEEDEGDDREDEEISLVDAQVSKRRSKQQRRLRPANSSNRSTPGRESASRRLNTVANSMKERTEVSAEFKQKLAPMDHKTRRLKIKKKYALRDKREDLNGELRRREMALREREMALREFQAGMIPAGLPTTSLATPA